MRIALVAFQGVAMCFAHVLLDALDMREKGHEVAVVIEGAACGLIPKLAEPGVPFGKQYAEICQQGLVKAVCKACASKIGGLAAAEEQGLPINGSMHGHPSLANYVAGGYQIITFQCLPPTTAESALPLAIAAVG